MAASENSIESWLESQFYYQDRIKMHIRTLFNLGNWRIINPPGDGFCGVYAMSISKKLHINKHVIHQGILQCPTKSQLARHITSGIE